MRRYLSKREAVSELTNEYKVASSMIYQWASRLMNNGDLALEDKRRGDSQTIKDMHRKVEAFQKRMSHKDAVIAELSSDYLQLKKALGSFDRPQGSPGTARWSDRLCRTFVQSCKIATYPMIAHLGIARMKHFETFICVTGMTHGRTSPYSPQSNGKIEAWHKKMKKRTIQNSSPRDFKHACEMVDSFVANYNEN